MATEAVVVKALDELRSVVTHIKKDVEEIKAKMVDSDSVMTEDDYEALLAYRKEKSAKKLVSHEQLKKFLGV